LLNVLGLHMLEHVTLVVAGVATLLTVPKLVLLPHVTGYVSEQSRHSLL
jgi:hypothetical protein